ncbi:HNH endonuclease signature motif containing protein [Corynebacterium sp.]|uniref:HNH endonuclease signature motif containing protein n=1 Tax=Corynebacterium sp. TaxID=1720 RepID=UPI0026DDAC71|nr:HNH endonuclease signature motif containing protein [Corynebacterium sp.]MDO5032585.1 HNH endonuclease signature motif containing protein [Corynebacterium sp.]
MSNNRAMFEAWSSVIPDPDADAELTYNHIGRSLGVSAHTAERMIYSLMLLAHMPQLTELNQQHWFLDAPRLSAIGFALLGAEKEILPHVDEALVGLFTPRRRNQHLPAAGDIKAAIKEVMDTFYQPLEEEDVPADHYEYIRGPQQGYLTLATDPATAEIIDALVRQRAKADGISQAEALVKIITEPVKASVRINTFQAQGSSLALLPGYGYQDLSRTPLDTTTRPILPASTEGYVPTENTRAFVEARDGTCRWPGCTVPAARCQLDHRVEYGRGGPTSTDNLACLCQHHHNIKTDKRAFYVMDPISGDIYWLMSDGTWVMTAPQGPLATHWKLTVAERIDLLNRNHVRDRRNPDHA